MENLQIAVPVAPATIAKAAPTTAETPDEGEALPWATALQAALTRHAKILKPGLAQGTPAKDPVDRSDAAAPGADGKGQTAADAALTALPAGMPLPLLTVLPSAHGDVQRASDTQALIASTGAVQGEPGAVAEPWTTPGHDTGKARIAQDLPATTGKAHVAPDVAASADALTRVIEHAAARDANGQETFVQPSVQFMLAHAVPAATPPATMHAWQLQINAAVGSAAWGAELGQKVVWMIGEKQHVAELRVNPPDLGPLEIKLTVSEHQTTAVFTSPHGAVRDAIESALPRLREVLAESGIMLGNASVTADTPRDGAAFAAPHEQAQRGAVDPQAEESVSARAQPGLGNPARRNGLVDLFA